LKSGFKFCKVDVQTVGGMQLLLKELEVNVSYFNDVVVGSGLRKAINDQHSKQFLQIKCLIDIQSW
jgi:hypothetical protein